MKFKKSNFKVILPVAALSIIACCGLIYYHSYTQRKYAFSQSVDRKIDLNNDGRKERVEFNKGKLNVTSPDGKVMFAKDTGEDTYSDIAFIKDKKANDTNIILTNKTKDTSGTLSFSIYKMDGNEMKEVVNKKDIYKGVVTVKSNGEILEETPVYEKNDSNAVPSYTVKEQYNLEDNKLVLVKSEKLKYSLSNVSSDSSQYYKNPSHAEIEKLLENVAYEKGIPPELLKAIAWQESRGTDNDNGGIENWRQFYNGQPLISYDHIGIGIMQISDYAGKSAAYIDRIKYDTEFNIREGAEILLQKWARQSSSGSDKITMVGDGAPTYLEHWYYATWAYNSYSEINNPASHYSTAYQTLVINHVNNVFNKPMIDLYTYNPSLFTVGVSPSTNIAEITGRHAGDFKKKDINIVCINTTDTLSIRDANMNYIGSFAKNDVVTIKGDPIIKNGYVRYYVEGNGKSGYVAGNWLQPVGDVNLDRFIDVYDFVNESKNIIGAGTTVNDSNRISMDKFDVNKDGVIDISDIALAAKNYNCYFYKNNFTN